MSTYRGMRRHVMAFCLIVTGAFCLPCAAIPTFSRQYGVSCSYCHSNYPELNAVGEEFREEGYRFPTAEEERLEGEVQEKQPAPALPISIEIQAGYVRDNFINEPDAQENNQFQVALAEVSSSAKLGPNIHYVLTWYPEINAGQGVTEQDGTLDEANVTFNSLGGSHLNLRVGRFEPAYVAFSINRLLSISPYAVYDFTPPSGLAFNETQTGIEVTGNTKNNIKYAFGWVDGSPNNTTDDAPEDVFIRLARQFGPHDTQGNPRSRIGVVGYLGQARPSTGGVPAAERYGFSRVGADALLNLDHRWSIGTVYLTGEDSKELAGTADDYNWSGGFVRLQYRPTDRLVGFARYGWVNTPDVINGDITRWTFGGRYNIADNVAWHLEYSRRTQQPPNPAPAETENTEEEFLTALLDFTF